MIDRIWLKKLQVVLITALFSIFFIFYSLSIENTYISQSILKVNNDSNSAFSEYSGLASMAGIELGGGGKKNSLEDIEAVLTSISFVEHLSSFEGVSLNIMAAKSYDFKNNLIIYDEEIYDVKKEEWVRDVDFPLTSKPGPVEIHEEYIDRIFSIRTEKTANIIDLSVEHVSPVFSKDFLQMIIDEINSLLRKRDLERSSMALKYLKEQLSSTPQVEVRNAINDLVRQQLNSMTTRINNDYVLTELDAPYLPMENLTEEIFNCYRWHNFGISLQYRFYPI